MCIAPCKGVFICTGRQHVVIVSSWFIYIPRCTKFESGLMQCHGQFLTKCTSCIFLWYVLRSRADLFRFVRCCGAKVNRPAAYSGSLSESAQCPTAKPCRACCTGITGTVQCFMGRRHMPSRRCQVRSRWRLSHEFVLEMRWHVNHMRWAKVTVNYDNWW